MNAVDHLSQPQRGSLRQLAEALRQSHTGLIDAAAKTSDIQVVKLLYQVAGERAKMIKQVEAMAQTEDRELSKRSTWFEMLRTAWSGIGIKTGMQELEDLLCGIETAEHLIIARYDETIEGMDNCSVEEILQRQRADIEDSLLRLTEVIAAQQSS